MRLLSLAHRQLLSGTRGAHKQPGEIRRSQNWIGGTRPGNAQFVPPPPHRLAELLADFESFIHEESALPPLVRVGLLHAQFETIHPFLDGNGRLGRLLIALLLKHWNLLPQPLLYLSLFLKVHRQEYYRRLDAIRSEGDWEGWLAFFLEGVASVAAEAVQTARNLNKIVKDCETRLLAQGETTLLSLRLLKALPEKPIVTVTRAVEILGCSRPAATKAIRVLVEAEVLRVASAKTKNREYRFDLYLDELRTGTELS